MLPFSAVGWLAGTGTGAAIFGSGLVGWYRDRCCWLWQWVGWYRRDRCCWLWQWVGLLVQEQVLLALALNWLVQGEGGGGGSVAGFGCGLVFGTGKGAVCFGTGLVGTGGGRGVAGFGSGLDGF